MRLSLTIFCIIIPILGHANSSDSKADIIAENYEAGPFLIYDCEEKHWTCVLESYATACDEKRAEDLEANKLEVRCATLGLLPTKRSCFQRQLFMVSQNFGQRFCIGNYWKEKEIVY